LYIGTETMLVDNTGQAYFNTQEQKQVLKDYRSDKANLSRQYIEDNVGKVELTSSQEGSMGIQGVKL
jgi:hypothetical protein